MSPILRRSRTHSLLGITTLDTWNHDTRYEWWPESEWHTHLINVYLNPLLVDCIDRKLEQPAADMRSLFAENLSEMERLIWGASSITILAKYFFPGLRCDIGEFPIEAGIIIRPTTLEEKRGLLSEDLAPLPAIVVQALPLADIRHPRFNDLRQRATAVGCRMEFALRLTGTEFTAVQSVAWDSDNRFLELPRRHPIYAAPGGHRLRISGEDDRGMLELTEDSLIPVQEAFALSDREIGDTSAQVAIRRLHESTIKGAPEDRLIDEWIALEALYLRHGEKTEMAYRASMRIARDLGTTLEQRRQIKKIVSDSYNHRSEGAVHGAAVAQRAGSKGAVKKRQHLAECERETARLLRQAIRKMLAVGHPPDIDQIEDAMLALGLAEE